MSAAHFKPDLGTYKMSKILLSLCLPLMLISVRLLADTPNSDATALQPYASLTANPHDAWLSEAWAGDNAPYQKIRHALEALNGKHLITPNVMSGYRQSYSNHKDASEMAFQWAYASYLAFNERTNFSREDIANPAILDPYPTPSPKTYDYDRLRFLYAVQGIAKPKYKLLAERLYKQNPDDVKVAAAYARVLSMTHMQEDEQKSLAIASRLVRQEPDNAKHLTLLGSIYFNAWFSFHKLQDKALSIQAYQSFLHKAPPGDPFRSQANKLIALLSDSR